MSDFEKLINASDLIEWILETFPDWCVGAVRSIVDHINEMSSATVERVGKWISHDVNGMDSIDRDVCSACGERFFQIAETGCEWNYCPNCGARMGDGNDK